MDYLWPCIGLVILSSLWNAYLEWRQRTVYKVTTRVPSELENVFEQETFDKSRLYQLDKSMYTMVYSMFKVFEFAMIIIFGVLPLTWNLAGSITNYFGYSSDYEVLQSAVFTVICIIYSDIIGIPWAAYHAFVLEEKHGFNKQTIGFFIKDKIKSFILQCIFLPAIIAGLVFVIKWGGEYFYIYAWLFVLVITLIFITIYHDFIAPCFDKFTPVPPGELRTSIEQLAASLSFPLKKLFIIEGSKRSAHSNAYFYGFGSNKCIVLFDTLLQKDMLPQEIEKSNEVEENDDANKDNENEDEQRQEKEKKDIVKDNENEDEQQQEKEEDTESEETEKKDEVKEKGCSIEEILAVLSHELGHWQYSHNLKNLFVAELNFFISFFLFGYFLNSQDMFSSFGFPDSRPIIIGFIIVFELIFTPYNLIFGFLLVQLHRRYEYQADAFAKNLNRGPALCSALTKLVQDNLSFPVADPLYAAFHQTHPTYLERIRTLKIKHE